MNYNSITGKVWEKKLRKLMMMMMMMAILMIMVIISQSKESSPYAHMFNNGKLTDNELL